MTDRRRSPGGGRVRGGTRRGAALGAGPARPTKSGGTVRRSSCSSPTSTACGPRAWTCRRRSPSATSASAGRSTSTSYGKVNGKTFNVIPVTWDPIDTASYEETCIKATQDHDPFVVLNGNGYRQSSVGCITVDNDTFMIIGEGGYDELYKASGKNLLTLGMPGEAARPRASVQLATKQKLFSEGRQDRHPVVDRARGLRRPATVAEKEFAKAGFDVVETVEINARPGRGRASSARRRRPWPRCRRPARTRWWSSSASPSTRRSSTRPRRRAPASSTCCSTPAASICTQFGASRTPAIIADAEVPCVTTWDTRALPTKDGVKPDNAFEAKCRKMFDEGFDEQTTPGRPVGRHHRRDGPDAHRGHLAQRVHHHGPVRAGLEEGGQERHPGGRVRRHAHDQEEPGRLHVERHRRLREEQAVLRQPGARGAAEPGDHGHRAGRQRALQRVPGADQLLGAAGRRRDRVGRARRERPEPPARSGRADTDPLGGLRLRPQI